MAVAATASMGLSAMVSAAAAQAAAALTTMGVEVGLGAALSGVGVDNMVRHLQLFALSGTQCMHQFCPGYTCLGVLMWLTCNLLMCGVLVWPAVILASACGLAFVRPSLHATSWLELAESCHGICCP